MNYLSILSGDTRYFWQEALHFFTGVPQAWDASLNTGIGQPQLSTLWITGYLYLTATLSNVGLSWNTIFILFWLLPPLVISFLSASLLFGQLFPKQRVLRWLAGFIYVFNTYFIMLFIGGQSGVLLAYSLVPFILLSFIKLFEKPTFRMSILAGLVVSLELLFDPRFLYLSVMLVAGYWLFMKFALKISGKNYIYWFLLPGAIVLLLHNYWIIPLIVFRSPAPQQAFDSVQAFTFFSFADFSHSLTLLHPNWPENVFGKVYFLESYFLFIPIVAFSSLLFVKNKLKGKNESKEKQNILFFVLVVILGAFLAKGTNDPFGNSNIFLFQHIPGMQMFRDATKFYTFIALAYSLLIPWVCFQLYERYKKKKFINVKIIHCSFIALWLVLHGFSYLRHPSAFSFMNTIPYEYVQLKDFISKDKDSFRTLWIPQVQRYGYFSPMHPAIGRGEIIGQADPVTLAKKLEKKNIQESLYLFNVKYIILPFDSEGEIFVNDRKYDEMMYKKTQAELDKNTAFHLTKTFGKTRVYEVPGVKDRFWINGKDVLWRYISSSHYQVESRNDNRDGTLVFSEAFDQNWIAYVDGKTIPSIKYKNYLNSFQLSGEKGVIDIYYKPQMWVNVGLMISGLTLITILSFFIRSFYKEKQKK